MTLTPIGFIVIVAGVFLFFYDIRKLYYFTVFSIPFTATSVIQTQSSNSLSAAHFLIFLLVLDELNNILKNLNYRLPKNKVQLNSIRLIFIFLLIIILSLIMPIIIDGALRVHTGETDNYLFGGDKPLFFSKSLIFRLYPIILGVVLIYLLVINLNIKFNMHKMLKYFSYSILFVSSWGLIQILSFYLNFNFPSDLFNTMDSSNMMEVNTVFGDYYSSFPRINSVTQEPSHLSLNLLCSLPILFVLYFLNKESNKKRNLNFIILLISSIILILSTSTTAILGIVVLFFISSYSLSKFKIYNTNKLFFIGLFLLSITLISYNNIEIVQSFINQILINKGETSSALVRAYTVSTSFEYFLKYPILGIGWSVATSDDLVILILANSGILGLVSFIAMIIYILKKSINLYNNDIYFKNLDQYFLINISFFISLTVFIMVSVFLGFLWYQPLFYFVVGILISNFNNSKLNYHDL